MVGDGESVLKCPHCGREEWGYYMEDVGITCVEKRAYCNFCDKDITEEVDDFLSAKEKERCCS